MANYLNTIIESWLTIGACHVGIGRFIDGELFMSRFFFNFLVKRCVDHTYSIPPLAWTECITSHITSCKISSILNSWFPVICVKD